MQIETCDSLADIDAGEWNALGDGSNPFVRHEFLSALETNGCVAAEFGWHAFHLLLRNDNKELIAAAPAYIKTNSYGEFVFDWAWAEAYERAGGEYYPKLICAVPFTPATGPRLLIKAEQDKKECSTLLANAAMAIVKQQNWSGVHWLFPLEHEAKAMTEKDYMLRIGCQYIWTNHTYSDFEDFLSHCTARKRKKMRRERKHVAEQNIQLQLMHGNELTEKDWKQVTGFYLDTFNRKWGTPTLNAKFFTEIGHTMGENVIVVFASHNEQRVACSVMLKGTDTLYGRYWGCTDDFHSLHFEACYYQGIDYCIEHGLKRFEPGAQGEHKIGRGFKPTLTWSTHYLTNDSFRDAVKQFLDQERPMMREHCQKLHDLLPFKQKDDPSNQ